MRYAIDNRGIARGVWAGPGSPASWLTATGSRRDLRDAG